jgi:SAM-dependent methyltransferase
MQNDNFGSHQEIYTDLMFVQSFPAGLEHHYWNITRNGIIARELIRFGLAKARLLDVGCATGIVVEALRAKGFDCKGVEPGHPVLKESLRPHVQTGITAEEMPEAQRNTIDVLLLCDVIEHLADPVALLVSLKKAFPNARHLIVTVPACPELWSNYDDYFGHHRRYTLSSLAEEMAAANITDILSSRYFFHLVYPAIMAITRLGKARMVEVQAPKQLFLHRFLGACFRWEDAIVPGFVPGSSIIAAARLAA